MNIVRCILFVFVICAVQVSSNEESGKQSSLRPSRQTNGVTTVLALELINAQTEKKVMDLAYGTFINVTSIGLTAPNFNVRAILNGPAKSVRFGFENNPNYHSEGAAPYALCKNKGKDYLTCTDLGYGVHYVSAQAINNGRPGPKKESTFIIG